MKLIDNAQITVCPLICVILPYFIPVVPRINYLINYFYLKPCFGVRFGEFKPRQLVTDIVLGSRYSGWDPGFGCYASQMATRVPLLVWSRVVYSITISKTIRYCGLGRHLIGSLHWSMQYPQCLGCIKVSIRTVELLGFAKGHCANNRCRLGN